MQYIDVNGTEYPVHFGSAAMNQFCLKFKIPKIGALIQRIFAAIPRKADGTFIENESEASQLNMADFDLPFSVEEIANVLRFGINDGYRKDGQATRIEEADAFDLLDEKPGLATEVAGIFIQSVLSLVAPAEKKAKAGPRKAALK